MNHFTAELSVVAFIPAIFLCGYVFYMDRIEKEPIGLLAILFGIGALSYIPTQLAQNIIIRIIDNLYADKIIYSEAGAISFTSSAAEFTHALCCSFLGFSLAKICINWLILFLVTRKNKHFNYLFDGIVYSTFISLSYTIVENIHFLTQNDAEMLIPKLLTSLTCNLFIGVLMGYYHTMWHMRFMANRIENDMLKANIVKEDRVRTSAGWLALSILVPFVLNGAYILAGTTNNDIVTLIFYTVVFFAFGSSFLIIRSMASKDVSYGRYLYRIIAKEHPQLQSQTLIEFINNGIDEDSKEIKA